MVKDYGLFAWKNIRTRGLRSWLTIMGIIIGIAAIISLITIGQGVQNAINEQFEKMGVSSIRVIPANLMGPPSATFSLSNEFIDKTEAISIVDYVDKVMADSGVMEFNNEEKFVNVIGYDVDLADKGFADLDVRAEEGRLFVPTDKGVIIVGNDLAKDTFDKDMSVKNNVVIEDKKFRVIGIFEKTGTTEVDKRVYMPLENARDLFNRPDDINALVLHLKDGVDMEEGQKAIERELLKTFDDEDFDLITPAQMLEMVTQVLGIIQVVLGGIAAISLVVGAIGIMNAMFTSVLERTQEIGLMKAVGAKNSDIAMIFLAEAGIMGSVGGLIGILIGTALAFAVGMTASALGFPYISIKVNFVIIISVLIFSFAIGAISGLVPAIQAAKLKPVDALRYE